MTPWTAATRLPYLSATPGAYSNSCPSCQWCRLTISYSVVPFSSWAFCFSQHQGLFQWVSSSHQVAKVLEFQLQHQSLQWIFQADFLQDWLVGSPCSPRDSQESSPTPQFENISSLALSFLFNPTLMSIHDYWKNHSFDKMDLCWLVSMDTYNSFPNWKSYWGFLIYEIPQKSQKIKFNYFYYLPINFCIYICLYKYIHVCMCLYTGCVKKKKYYRFL